MYIFFLKHYEILKIETRAALAHYVLKELLTNAKILDGKPEAQQLMLSNIEEIKTLAIFSIDIWRSNCN